MSTSGGGTTTDDIRDELAEKERLMIQDINRQALGQTVETSTYRIPGVGTISFVNVSTGIITALQGTGSPAGDTTPPAQVTGVTVGSPTISSLTVSWTANVEADLGNYNVYRGTVSGFTVVPGSTIPTGTPTTNSFIDSGLSPSTTYYYKVLAVDTSSNLGSISTQASGTTSSGGTSVIPDLWLKLDNNYADSSGNGNSTGFTTSTFGTPGKFGSHYYVQNTGATSDYLTTVVSTSTALDFTTGFSYSLWVYPSTIPQTGMILGKITNATNQVEISLSIANELLCYVTEAGVTVGKKFASALTANTWCHVVLTYDAATNTVNLYKDKVAATTSNVSGFGVSRTNLIIGNGNADLSTPFKGRIDEVQYFKGKVLTQTQIDSLFATNSATAAPPDTTPPAQVTGVVVS
jgi:hypothetical protein